MDDSVVERFQGRQSPAYNVDEYLRTRPDVQRDYLPTDITSNGEGV